MIQGKVWHLKVDRQMRLRINGSKANELREVLNLPKTINTPLEWWANLGEKGQLIAIPKFSLSSDLEGVVDEVSLRRYEAGMILTIRREEPNRITLQLPVEALHLGAIPDVGAIASLYAQSNILEIWKADQWKEDAIKTASLLAAQLARVGE